jgi:hypothetical protein
LKYKHETTVSGEAKMRSLEVVMGGVSSDELEF